MTRACMASPSFTLSKSLIACLAAALLAAPGAAQTSRDALMRGFFENAVNQRRIDASIAEGQRVAKGQPQTAGVSTSPTAQPVSVDPAVWGVLAKLVGHRWQTADGVVRVFEWSTDGRELVESELVGGSPKPMALFSIQDNELVQYECLIGFPTCIRFGSRFGSVADDGSVLFKEIVAVGRSKTPSVILRERPVEDWSKWKSKYLLVGERLSTYQLVGEGQLEVTQSFSGKWTDAPAEAPWGAAEALPTLAYSRAGEASPQAGSVASANFGPMEIFAGQRMMSEDRTHILELQHLPDGSQAIQWFSYYGEPLVRYAFVAGAGDGQLEVREYPFPKSSGYFLSSRGFWVQGGTLMFRTELQGTGRSFSHHFSVSEGKLVVDRYDTWMGTTLLGKPKVKDFSSTKHIYVPATPEMIAEAAAAHERRLESERLRAEHNAERERLRQAQEERDAARYMSALGAFANAFNESMAESHANEARQQAFLDDLRERMEEIDRRRTAQQQAQAEPPRSVQQPVQVPSRAPSQEPAPAARTQESRVAATSTQERTEPPRQRLNLIETLEAIVVCTHPDEQGRFKCETPVDVIRGGPTHGESWRTPEVVVSNQPSCVNARRLHSTTHLVWGCGYGATNGNNTLDRSAGVDVKGRNTYYCVAREWPCRRTTPE
jgi:hypothetical protein